MDQTGEKTETSETKCCLECGKTVGPDEGTTTKSGVFCNVCYGSLLDQVETLVKAGSEDINYPMAVAGALAGGILGVLAWWGFTVLTQYAIGLVAIVIGIAVGKGITLATGGKRSKGLQGIAVSVTVLSYFYADYLVSRSFLIKQEPLFAAKLSLLPAPALIFNICRLNLTSDALGLVFLGIAMWQAYRMTQPVKFV
ncbi:MAG: hypothetical protein M0Z56_06350 [Desulfobacteraceae bacterium]|nr:hypothetical protein [Desulfobacteraceae bacterium]